MLYHGHDVTPTIELDGARLICFAEITSAVRWTEASTHRRDGQVLGPARGLAICQYPTENSFYLFYCDEDWKAHTDTFHVRIKDAKEQAEFEYEGISGCWDDAIKAD